MKADLPNLRSICEARGLFDVLTFLKNIFEEQGVKSLSAILSEGELPEKTWLRNGVTGLLHDADEHGSEWIERSGTDHLEALIAETSFNNKVVSVEFARLILELAES